MTSQMIGFIVLLVLNTLVAVIYLLWNRSQREEEDQKSGIIRFVIMLLCPVVAPFFFWLAHLMFELFFREPVSLEDVVFSKERARTFVHAEEERERNIVPLEEAIEITDKSGLRTLMMNVVRGDIHKSLASISGALNSEDTETAHYAASVLQDALNDFRIHVEKQRQLILEGDEKQSYYADNLLEYMNQVLEQKVFTDMEQQTYVVVMDEIGEIFYANARQKMTSSHFEALSLRLLEIEDYDNCRKWCERARLHYPGALATYTCQLKLYFNSGQKEKFFEVIDALKQSAVVIDSETLELIRVFR